MYKFPLAVSQELPGGLEVSFAAVSQCSAPPRGHPEGPDECPLDEGSHEEWAWIVLVRMSERL